MSELPQIVVDYLTRLAMARETPAYLLVDECGIVVRTGGALDRFGLAMDAVGTSVEAHIAALAGLVPVGPEPLWLPTVELASDIYADVHGFDDERGTWIVLVDRSEWAAERRLAQQLSNDMSLLREELARRTHTGASAAWSSALDAAGERRFASVATFVLHGLAGGADDVAVETALGDAGLFGRAVARAVVDEAGIVHAVCGDRITAVFGALPTTAAPADLAAVSALRALDAVAELNAARSRDGSRVVPCSVGIASGSLAIGPLGGRANRMLGALGACVERSPRVAHLARPGDVVVDEATRDALGALQPRFEAVSDRGDGIDGLPTFRMVTR